MAFINLFIIENNLHKTYNAKKILLNGLIYAETKEVKILIENGYKSIKVKIGADPKKDADKIIQIRKIIPENVSLRLDANRQWNFEKALEFAKFAKCENVEYIEEPFYLSSEEKNMKSKSSKYTEFAEQTGFKIALDETFAENKIFYSGVDFLVLKPSLFGSISTIKEILNESKHRQIKIVISNTIQSEVTISFLKMLVIELGLENRPMGLTIPKFKEQIKRDFLL